MEGGRIGLFLFSVTRTVVTWLMVLYKYLEVLRLGVLNISRSSPSCKLNDLLSSSFQLSVEIFGADSIDMEKVWRSECPAQGQWPVSGALTALKTVSSRFWNRNLTFKAWIFSGFQNWPCQLGLPIFLCSRKMWKCSYWNVHL